MNTNTVDKLVHLESQSEKRIKIDNYFGEYFVFGERSAILEAKTGLKSFILGVTSEAIISIYILIMFKFFL